jgi:transaldolase
MQPPIHPWYSSKPVSRVCKTAFLQHANASIAASLVRSAKRQQIWQCNSARRSPRSSREGLEACRILEAEGIGCNLTLVFAEEQAIVAAAAKATLISPFVGRIYDWYVTRGETPADASVDPGVLSVQRIHWLYRSHGIATIVMGASFRTADQVLALAGCDRLTISPSILEELDGRHTPVHPLEAPPRLASPMPVLDRDQFLLRMAANPMATEKLADGINRFVNDQIALEALIQG